MNVKSAFLNNDL
jgi:hypothetical protein